MEGKVVPPMAESTEKARRRARASATDGKGDAARSEASRVAISVFGSALTVAAALAALILTSAHYTRQHFQDQLELTRRHFAEQNELMRRNFTEQNELMRSHSDSQFEHLREDLREVREEVRALAERQAKVEGLLLAVHRTGLAPRSPARSADSSASRTENPASE